MGSFYGNGGWTSNNTGGSGTTNYNDLTNQPIVNLIGTESSPVTLNELEYGIYLIKGSYRYNAIDEIKQSSSPLSIQIFADSATGNKAAKFEVMENQELIIITVYYSDDEFIEDRFAINDSTCECSHIAEEVVLGTF